MMKSPLNEDTSSFAVIWRRDAFVTYLPILLEWEEAQPKNLHVVHLKFQFTALSTQSGINFAIYDYLNCIRTFLSFFAETWSPTVFLVFWITSPKPCRRCIWIILSKSRRRFIFDDDLGHGNHSGELLLFVGCIVNFFVSYLICMFQDSVPAGSYNDPFLSSVIPMVTPTWCHRANWGNPV